MNLKENIFTNFVTNKLETVVNSKKNSNFEKYHREWYFSRRY